MFERNDLKRMLNDATRPKREPSAEHREMAEGLHEMFVAHVDAGFTEKQALDLIAAIIVGHGKGDQ